MPEDKKRTWLLERYKAMQLTCENYAALMPCGYYSCATALAKSHNPRIDSLTVLLAQLVDDMATEIFSRKEK